MYNLYSITKSQQAIRQLTLAMSDTTGNLPSMPAVFPDYAAPVVRNGRDGGRELTLMRWGFPPPGIGPQLVINVRNVKSPYRRGWLKPEWRVVVPATSFAEYEDTKPRKTPVWFALDQTRSLFCFAGIWCPWTGVRGTKADPIEGEHRLFSFLTTEANAVVKPVHAKAMPVVLSTPDEWDVWLNAPVEGALQLQRPLPDDALRVVASGARSD